MTEICLPTIREVEARLYERALVVYHGNKMAVAKALGVCIRTVRKKVHEYSNLKKWRVPTNEVKGVINGLKEISKSCEEAWLALQQMPIWINADTRKRKVIIEYLESVFDV